MGLQLVTAATSLPVTVEDVIAELFSYEETAENAVIVEQKLREAVDFIEGQTCQRYIQSTWLQTFNAWPGYDCDGFYSFKINLAPLVSISSVKYYNSDGTQTTVSSAYYWTVTTSTPPKIAFKPTFDWPALEVGRPDAIEVRFVAGYASAGAVPPKAKSAVRMLAQYWFEQRQPTSTSVAAAPNESAPTVNELPWGLRQMIQDLSASGYT